MMKSWLELDAKNNAGAEPVPLWDATWEDGQDKATGKAKFLRLIVGW
jgi:hypothetical protein